MWGSWDKSPVSVQPEPGLAPSEGHPGHQGVGLYGAGRSWQAGQVPILTREEEELLGEHVLEGSVDGGRKGWPRGLDPEWALNRPLPGHRAFPVIPEGARSQRHAGSMGSEPQCPSAPQKPLPSSALLQQTWGSHSRGEGAPPAPFISRGLGAAPVGSRGDSRIKCPCRYQGLGSPHPCAPHPHCRHHWAQGAGLTHPLLKKCSSPLISVMASKELTLQASLLGSTGLGSVGQG